jgi:hypothetical protein
MRKISIDKFSCIEEAEIEFAPLTIIIGPQASGKSVATKLAYFFLTLYTDHVELLREGENYATFRKHVGRKFAEWFPTSAWGKKQFCIEFEWGAFQARITRRARGERVSDNVSVWFSPQFKEHYEVAMKSFADGEQDAQPVSERFWRSDEVVRRSFDSIFGEEYPQSALFIPAGRAFFTSIGKALLLFEQSKGLDPVTIRFGRLYAALRDRLSPHLQPGTVRARFSLVQRMQKVLGGELRSNREGDFVQMADGRKVPFSALSSGQQELLPLLQTVDYWNRNRARSQIMFIEEPEAHLFPSAQSDLVEALTSVFQGFRRGQLVMTTHSPYVLAKLNCLIKAGQLQDKFGDLIIPSLDKLVPRGARLAPGTLNAYAICDGRVKNIFGEDALIAADYLDEVSSEIAREFDRLLQLEREHVHT